jgi:hypothetical protein
MLCSGACRRIYISKSISLAVVALSCRYGSVSPRMITAASCAWRTSPRDEGLQPTCPLQSPVQACSASLG